MLPIQKILWPTDFSNASYKALDAALELAVQFSAGLWIVHAVGPVRSMPAPGNFPFPAYYQERVDAATQRIYEVIKEKIQDACPVQVIVEMAEPADKIIQLAEGMPVDMIVISSHGESPFHHLLFGSVAEKVIRRATCPVLVIKAPETKT
jgi:universal stress protein A